MLRRWRQGRRCSAKAKRCEQPVLAQYLESCAALRPETIGDTPIIVVDIETTGLNAASDHIISLGWTLIDNGRIRLGENRHVLVSAQSKVGKSATIHELTDKEVSSGIPVDEALEQLFMAAAGRVWVFHHSALDISFLKKACRAWASMLAPFTYLDTMQIELGLRKRRNQPVQQGDLQLGQLRSQYNLPRYTAHNALTDALATAELLLAMASRLDRKKSLDLGPFLRFA